MIYDNCRQVLRSAALTLLGAMLLPVGDASALSLQEAREEALQANLGIKSAQEKTIQADQLSAESYTRLFPTLSLVGQSNYVSQDGGTTIQRGEWGTYPFMGPIPSSDSKVVSENKGWSHTGSIRLQQPIFMGGRIWFNYKAMKSTHTEATWNEEQSVQDILLNTEKAYFLLLKAIEQRSVSESHKIAVAAQLGDMEKRYKYGRVPLNDLLKARVQLAEADRDLVRANNGVVIAEGQVNLLLNRPLEQPVGPLPVADPAPVTLTSVEVREFAKLANKALSSARAKQKTAEFQRRVAEADYYPQVAFNAAYNAQSGSPNYRDKWWSVGIGLEWQFWQWGGTKKKVNAAKAYERQVEYDALSLENQTVAQARDAFLAINEADQKILVDRETLNQAEENRRIISIGFRNGRNTVTEVLIAEELLAKAKAMLVQDTYDAHVARAQLRFLMGKMEFLDFLTVRPVHVNTYNQVSGNPVMPNAEPMEPVMSGSIGPKTQELAEPIAANAETHESAIRQ